MSVHRKMSIQARWRQEGRSITFFHYERSKVRAYALIIYHQKGLYLPALNMKNSLFPVFLFFPKAQYSTWLAICLVSSLILLLPRDSLQLTRTQPHRQVNKQTCILPLSRLGCAATPACHIPATNAKQQRYK